MEGNEQGETAVRRSACEQEAAEAEAAVAKLVPALQPCCQHLLSLQHQRSTLYSAFKQELRELDARYSLQVTPLYAQRKALLEQYQLQSGFWLQAMKRNNEIRDYIFAQDEMALRYLVDIEMKERENSPDFQLFFRFQENPYIEDPVLVKSFVYDENEELLRAEGCEIHWKGDKLTQKKVKTKRARKGKTTMSAKTVPTFSFFTFFQTSVKDNIDDSDDSEGDSGPRHLQMVEDDEDIGQAIREEVIPNALLYYLGVRGEDSESEGSEEEELETITESDH